MTVELDDRLRELFADERLDVPAPPDVAGAIVAGARRRRRTRVAVASTFALTVLVAGGAVAGDVGPGLLGEPASPPGSTVVETATVTVTSLPPEPAAYATLRLGMPAEEAVAATPGMTLVRTDTCAFYSLPAVPGDAVVVSPRYGVARITRPGTSVTPSRLVGLGSSVEEVLKGYPQAVRRGDVITARMPGPPEWRYAFPLDDGVVEAVRMELVGTDCPLEDG
ncbi:hypothetical protein AB0425_03435 [Actinosynnema sp. NPDC051121]